MTSDYDRVHSGVVAGKLYLGNLSQKGANMRTINVIAIVTFLLIDSSAPAEILADSVAEFSGVQGQNNWYYGYWDRTHDADDQYSPVEFQPMTQFLTGPSQNYGSLYVPAWYVQDGSFWSSLHATGGIPNGLDNNQGRLPFEHWTTRRWISEISGTIDIVGEIGYQNLVGGGFVARLRIDGVGIWNQLVTGGDGAIYEYVVSGTVTSGSRVDFIIDPYQSSDISDHIRYTAQITPEPSAIVLLLFSALGRRSRRSSF